MVSWTRIILTVFLGLALWAIASVMARAEIRILASPGGEAMAHSVVASQIILAKAVRIPEHSFDRMTTS